MNITKAFCIELGKSINIIDARNAYFAQEISRENPKRKKLTFLCSSPECRSDEINPVVIIGVNHHQVIEDNPSYRRPHFRSKDVSAHSPNCHWLIEAQKQQQQIDRAQNSTARSRLKKEYKDGYIQHSTFLIKEAITSKSVLDECSEQKDSSTNNLLTT